MASSTETAKQWRVERHGGMTRGSGSYWRVVAKGDEETCREVYANHKTMLRRGGVRLFDPEGVCLDACSAPRLRSRW